jgi:hypothetical protein
MVVSPARRNRKAKTEEIVIYNQPEEPQVKPAKIIMSDGTEYQGRIVSGKSKRVFQTDRNKLLLTFEISRTERAHI